MTSKGKDCFCEDEFDVYVKKKLVQFRRTDEVEVMQIKDSRKIAAERHSNKCKQEVVSCD